MRTVIDFLDQLPKQKQCNIIKFSSNIRFDQYTLILYYKLRVFHEYVKSAIRNKKIIERKKDLAIVIELCM